MKPRHRHEARRLAVQALYQWEIAAQPVDIIIAQYLQGEQAKKIDQDYFKLLLSEITEQVEMLQQTFIPYLDRDIKELNPIELSILRIAVYELLQRLDIPYRVVLNEAIELSKEFGAADGHKYVNGVLDKVVPQLRSAEK